MAKYRNAEGRRKQREKQGEFSDGYNSALREAQQRGASDAEALSEARMMGFSNGLGTIISDKLNGIIPGSDSVKDSARKESAGNVVGGLVSNALGMGTRYNSLVRAYTNQSMSKEEAERLATREIIKEIGSEALDDMFSGVAYGLGRSNNTLKRNLFRK